MSTGDASGSTGGVEVKNNASGGWIAGVVILLGVVLVALGLVVRQQGSNPIEKQLKLSAMAIHQNPMYAANIGHGTDDAVHTLKRGDTIYAIPMEVEGATLQAPVPGRNELHAFSEGGRTYAIPMMVATSTTPC